MRRSLDELTALFERLGADDPASRAASQHGEGIGRLHRYLLLRQAWRSVVDENDEAWIDRAIEYSRKRPLDPYAGSRAAGINRSGQALSRHDGGRSKGAFRGKRPFVPAAGPGCGPSGAFCEGHRR